MALTVTDPQPSTGPEEILTPEALAFVEELHLRFAGTRAELLKARAVKREQWPGPAAWTSCRRPRRSATATGASPRRPRPCRTAGWK